jgi:molecular chaperone DnaK
VVALVPLRPFEQFPYVKSGIVDAGASRLTPIVNDDTQQIVPPGLRFKVPLGVDQLVIIPKQRQLKLEFGFTTPGATNRDQASGDPEPESSMVTGDLNMALVEWVVQYRIEDAEKYLKVPVTDAVITVPAYFNDSERTATITAGRLAGLNVLQIINEPTSAALAYGLDKLDEDQTVFVFDLGGGTFDVTLMKIEGHRLEMVATNGDHRLGGKDWDDCIVNYVAEEFDRAHGENPLLDLQSYQDLQSRALAAKIQLSTRVRTTIVHSHNGQSVKVDLTREDFEHRTRQLVEKCKTICEMVMQEAGMKWSEIDKVLLVGGMTRMPMVRDMIYKLSSAPLIDDVNPDEAVSIGAALQAVLSLLEEEEISGEKFLPDSTRQQFSSREGGLIQVTDITSHTLGVVLWDEGLLEEYVFPMIRKMTAIPASVKNSFGTATANMERAIVRVVEGERVVEQRVEPRGPVVRRNNHRHVETILIGHTCVSSRYSSDPSICRSEPSSPTSRTTLLIVGRVH